MAKSIYPTAELVRRIEDIAAEQDRSFNQQVIRFLKVSVNRHERKRGRAKEGATCRV